MRLLYFVLQTCEEASGLRRATPDEAHVRLGSMRGLRAIAIVLLQAFGKRHSAALLPFNLSRLVPKMEEMQESILEAVKKRQSEFLANLE